MAMVRRVMTNMVFMDWMKCSVSGGTCGSRQPIRDSNSTEEIPAETDWLVPLKKCNEILLKISQVIDWRISNDGGVWENQQIWDNEIS